jgi:hypothetical protein
MWIQYSACYPSRIINRREVVREVVRVQASPNAKREDIASESCEVQVDLVSYSNLNVYYGAICAYSSTTFPQR